MERFNIIDCYVPINEHSLKEICDLLINSNIIEENEHLEFNHVGESILNLRRPDKYPHWGAKADIIHEINDLNYVFYLLGEIINISGGDSWIIFYDNKEDDTIKITKSKVTYMTKFSE